MENDVLVSYTNEEDILRVIMEETESRFSLADEAPISNHSISKELGDFGETEAAQQLLGGFLPVPADLDEATKAILEEIIKVRQEFKGKNVEASFTTKRFQDIWLHPREATASSFSGGHFGNYMASAKSDYLLGIYPDYTSYCTLFRTIHPSVPQFCPVPFCAAIQQQQ
jgi:hypothetical protein